MFSVVEAVTLALAVIRTSMLSSSMNGSVPLSICLSIRPSHLFDYVSIIVSSWNFRVITNDRSAVHAKRQGQRSKVKVTEVNTQLSRFRTVTPVWIQMWWWKDAYSLMLLRRGALLFVKVIPNIYGTGINAEIYDQSQVDILWL